MPAISTTAPCGPSSSRAYQDAIGETSTDDAPWFVVPADSNSRRNMAVGEILRATLERLDPQIPEPEAGLDGVKVV